MTRYLSTRTVWSGTEEGNGEKWHLMFVLLYYFQ